MSSAIMNSTDFNVDGYADLAVLGSFDEHGYLEPRVDVLLGGAKNTLTKGARFCCGFYAYDSIGIGRSGPPAIGDFNHDGYLDVAIAETSVFTDQSAGISCPLCRFSSEMVKATFPRRAGTRRYNFQLLGGRGLQRRREGRSCFPGRLDFRDPDRHRRWNLCASGHLFGGRESGICAPARR